MRFHILFAIIGYSFVANAINKPSDCSEFNGHYRGTCTITKRSLAGNILETDVRSEVTLSIDRDCTKVKEISASWTSGNSIYHIINMDKRSRPNIAAYPFDRVTSLDDVYQGKGALIPTFCNGILDIAAGEVANYEVAGLESFSWRYRFTKGSQGINMSGAFTQLARSSQISLGYECFFEETQQ